jgi:hypothetical protein
MASSIANMSYLCLPVVVFASRTHRELANGSI